MRRSLVLTVALLSLSACAEFDALNTALGGGAPPPTVSRPAPATAQPIPAAGARSAETLDQSTPQARAAATRTGAAGPVLGKTVATLGSPAEQGFWLKTPLVSDRGPGQVRNPATGKSVAVTLIPIDGPATAGSRLSLSAMRALEVGLTDLVTVDVTR